MLAHPRTFKFFFKNFIKVNLLAPESQLVSFAKINLIKCSLIQRLIELLS